MHLKLQSVYVEHHRCASAQLRMKHNILMNIEGARVTPSVLVDLNATFDTVQHQVFLDCLHAKFGIVHKVLEGFTSYLADRSEHVVVDGGLAFFSVSTKAWGPQGSSLGPFLFSIDIGKLFDIMKKHSLVATAMQMTHSRTRNTLGDGKAALEATRSCIDDPLSLDG